MAAKVRLGGKDARSPIDAVLVGDDLFHTDVIDDSEGWVNPFWLEMVENVASREIDGLRLILAPAATHDAGMDTPDPLRERVRGPAVARALGIAPNTLSEWARTGRHGIPPGIYLENSGWTFAKDEIEQWILKLEQDSSRKS